jgi:hypothetical protein
MAELDGYGCDDFRVERRSKKRALANTDPKASDVGVRPVR